MRNEAAAPHHSVTGCDLMRDPPGKPPPPADPATLVAAATQVERTRVVLQRYPDVAAAVAAGFVLSNPGPPGSCLPDHLIDWSRMDGEFDIDEPEMLLAAGTSLDDPVIAASYYVVASSPPDGFAGADDRWHPHGGMCVDSSGLGREVAERECTSGSYYGAGWMVHVWADPAHPNTIGMFEVTYPGFRTVG